MMLMSEYFNLCFDVSEVIQSSSFNEKMSCRISAGLVSFLVLQWLSLVEASHFRHGVIMWAPVDSYSNTVWIISSKIAALHNFTIMFSVTAVRSSANFDA